MRPGIKAINPPLWEKMTAIYRDWVQEDSFFSRDAPKPASPVPYHSVRELVSRIAGPGAVSLGSSSEFPKIPDLEMPLSQLLKLTYKVKTMQQPVANLVFHGLCLAPLPDLLYETLSSLESAEGLAEAKALLAGSRYSSWPAMLDALAEGPVATDLAYELLTIFNEVTGNRTLWSYFTDAVGPLGYRTWWPAAATGVGRLEAEHSTQTTHGTVTISVERYSAASDLSVQPYEWRAELRTTPESNPPDAIAYGTVYVLARDAEAPNRPAADLRRAAAALSDYDVAQVLAFLSQTLDAKALMADGALCFLWLWERKEGSLQGLGAECLTAALRDLKERFPSLKTFVIDLQPAPFIWDALEEPPQVQTAKHEALEKLERFISGLAPQRLLDGELRFILCTEFDADETHAALVAADLAEVEAEKKPPNKNKGGF